MTFRTQLRATRTSIALRLLSFVFLIAVCADIHNLRADVAIDMAVKTSLLNKIASYETSSGDVLTPAFKDLGYTPKSPTLWKSFPAIRKLSEFYAAAEAGAQGDGDRALAAVSDKLSQRFDSLRNNSTVSDFRKGRDLNSPFKFVQDAKLTVTSVPTQTRSVIQSLSSYVERGRLGGSYSIMVKNFGLESSRAFSILATSDSASEALLRAIGEVSIDRQVESLKSLVADVKVRYPALTASSEIAAFERAVAISDTGDSLEDLMKDLGSARPSDLVECLCGGRVIGTMPRSACHVGMPCR
ncbi:hypothetical protein AB7645_39885 [Bradyrhizobium sp. 956_D2_N1_5]|uniref:hypothetical protein n=1 Tax=unclassified Bradyrhizobium TaxID=2631580 RepID=UPI003F2290A3